MEIEQCKVTVCTEVCGHSDPAGASEPNIPQWPLPQPGVLIIFDIIILLYYYNPVNLA